VIFAIGMMTAMLCAVILTPLSARVATRLGIVDLPGDRRTHVGAVPRLGGAAVVASAAIAFLVALVAAESLGRSLDLTSLAPLLGGSLLVFVTGLWDDVSALTPWQKLLGEGTAALVVVAGGVVISRITVFGTTFELGFLTPVVTVIWIVGVTNAFNLVDGVDGLAGGLIAIAATTCTIVLVGRGHTVDALLLVALTGAITGFLPWNLYPARVFLGDAGALFSGFLLAATAVTGWQKGTTVLAVAVPLLIFALPILDTTAAIGRRARESQRFAGRSVLDRLGALRGILHGDRSHVHHKLLDLGLSPRAVVALLCALSVACSALALLSAEFE
jgi:UDP-GlcNAc:undecaprenyl-phosphate GlcNAc-1-phosphate transferase